MKTLHENIIMDLITVYLAGEASKETCELIETYSASDPKIAQLINSARTNTYNLTEASNLPDDLERKTILKVRRSIRRRMVYVMIATVMLLMIPFTAMMFTSEVNWSPADFIIMGILIAGTGSAYIFISGISDNTSYKIAVGISAITGFLIIWINLAVGIIGDPGNQANLLYAGIFIAGIAGAIISRLKPSGLSLTLYLMSIYQLIIPLLVIIIPGIKLPQSPEITPVLLFNTFFAGLFAFAGWLFKRAAHKNRKV